jgi:hypothetical protein
MAREDKHSEASDDKMGSAGHETGLSADEPSALGTAGIYATPAHEEGEEAEATAKQKA